MTTTKEIYFWVFGSVFEKLLEPVDLLLKKYVIVFSIDIEEMSIL